MRRVLTTLIAAILGLWLGALVVSGIAAAIAFPTMRDLDPTLPAFDAYPGDHWSIAAGSVMAKVFDAVGFVQMLCLAAVGILLIARRVFAPAPRTTVSGVLLPVLVACAGACVFISSVFVSPRMERDMNAYWTAARTGDAAGADASKALFDADHPTASRLMGATALFVLASTGAACWSAASRSARDAGA